MWYGAAKEREHDQGDGAVPRRSWDSAYTYLGAHPAPQGYTFRVWAPHARCVALAGDFNDWQGADMHRDADGVWSLTVENAAVYDSYKYIVTGADGTDTSRLRQQGVRPVGLRLA